METPRFSVQARAVRKRLQTFSDESTRANGPAQRTTVVATKKRECPIDYVCVELTGLAPVAMQQLVRRPVGSSHSAAPACCLDAPMRRGFSAKRCADEKLHQSDQPSCPPKNEEGSSHGRHSGYAYETSPKSG